MKPKLLFSLFAIAIMLMAALPTQAQKNEAYVVVSDDGATLTFYYDAQKSSRTGTVYGIMKPDTKADARLGQEFPKLIIHGLLRSCSIHRSRTTARQPHVVGLAIAEP